MILMCPHCGRRFVVPPHREADFLHRCPNCGAEFDAGRGTAAEQKPAAAPEREEVAFPTKPIEPKDCEVLKELSRQGAGILYQARHPEVKGHVALKAFLPDYPVAQGTLARWTRACKLAERVTHPRLARILGAGLYEQVPCLVRQFVEGESLSSLLEQGAVDPKQGTFLLGQALEGLEVAHSKQVAHGNLKPSNIIIDRRGRAVICDVGLYPEPDAPAGAAHRLNSWPYMAPELGHGADPTVASDVFSAAAILYHVATGRPPFDAAETSAAAKEAGRYMAPEKVNKKVSVFLSFVIAEGMRGNPKARYPGVHPMMVDLKRVYKGQQPLTYKPRRHPALRALRVILYLLLFAGLLGTVGLGGFMQYRRTQKKRAEELLAEAREELQAGRFSEATRLANDVLHVYPPLAASAYVVNARAALSGGRFEEVLQIVAEALSKSSGDPRAQVQLHWLRARALACQGQFDKAGSVLGLLDVNVFKRVIETDELCDFLATIVSIHEKKGGEPARAAAFLNDTLLPMVADSSVAAGLCYSAGVLLRATGQDEQAAELLRKSLASGEQLPAAAKALRELLETSDEPVDDDTIRLLEAYPLELALLGFSRLLHARHDEAQRLAAPLRAAGQLPEDAQRILALMDARAAQLASRNNQALDAYVQLSGREDVAGRWARYFASVLRFETGQTGLAADGFADLLSKSYSPPELRAQTALYLGHSWRARGKSDQSIAFYRMSREGAAPTDMQARALLAEIEAYCETRALTEAERLLDTLVAADKPGILAASAQYLLGRRPALPEVADEYHKRYLEGLRYEVAGRALDAYQTYKLLIEVGDGKSWYATAARFRLQLLKR